MSPLASRMEDRRKGRFSTGRIRPREWLFPLLLSALLLVLVGIPYRDGYQRSTPARPFLGLIGGDAIDDNNVYLGLMRQAADGRSLFSNNFTPEPNAPALFNFLYLVLGRISRWTGWSVDSVHQGFIAFSILLLVAAVYAFIAAGVRRPRYRRWALVLACFGGGFLWLARLVLKATGVDLHPITPWLVEINLFHAMLVYPHFVFAAALMTGGLALLLKAERERRFLPALAAGAAGTILAGSHAFEAVAFIPIAVAYLIVDGLAAGRLPGINRWKCLVAAVAPAMGMLLVNRWILLRQPMWGDVVARLDFSTPEPFRLALGLGASFFIVILTFDGLLAPRRPAGETMSKVWVVVTLALAYVPLLNWRWHLLNGIQIPLSVLAVQGLRRTALRALRLRRRRERPSTVGRLREPAFVAVVTAACCLSATNLFQSYRHEVAKVGPPAYLEAGELEAMRWLGRESSTETLILGSYLTGNYLPRVAGRRVFLGEDKLTHEYDQRQAEVREFFSRDWDDSRREALLRRFGVEYVFYGDEERKLGSYDPGAAPFLSEVYRKDGVSIYRFDSAGTRAGRRPDGEPARGNGK